MQDANQRLVPLALTAHQKVTPILHDIERRTDAGLDAALIRTVAAIVNDVPNGDLQAFAHYLGVDDCRIESIYVEPCGSVFVA